MPTPAAWEQSEAHLAGIRLRVRRLMSSGGAPLLLLHGLGVSGAVWQPFGRRFSPRFNVVAPDLRGHGDSARSPDGAYAPGDYAGDVAQLLLQLGFARTVVVGHSLGALVALSLAAARPALTGAIVLLDPPMDAGAAPLGVETIYRLRSAELGVLEDYLRGDTLLGAPSAATALATLIRSADNRAFEALLRAPAGHPVSWMDAARCVGPALVVQADIAAGGVLSDEVARELADALPGGRLVAIPGARHAIHASHPQQLKDAIITFLESLPSTYPGYPRYPG